MVCLKFQNMLNFVIFKNMECSILFPFSYYLDLLGLFVYNLERSWSSLEKAVET